MAEPSGRQPGNDVDAVAEELSSWAARVEADGVIPDSHFRRLADAGLYGPFVPDELGGRGLDPLGVADVVERLAAGCLATTFVLIQHFGVVGALLEPSCPPALRSDLLPGLISGSRRGGVALVGQWPGPARLRAERVGDDWILDGEAPWVTGWSYLDVVLVVARSGPDRLAVFLIDAVPQAGLTVERYRLAVVDASATVRLELRSVRVPGDRLVAERPFDPVRQLTEGLRTNGSLALGLTRRCAALTGSEVLAAELDHCRQRLDTATPDAMPAARAAASELAVRAAASLVVATGSEAARAGAIAERTWREASFLLVFGSRPGIKAALLRSFSQPSAVTGEVEL